MQTQIDHLVIGAADLAQGVAFVKTALGVDMPVGGVHEQLGTHNHLMRLGDTQFLEVIAINPNAAPPSRPRWFGLDDAYVQQALRQQPALLTWVVNTDNLEFLLQRARQPWGEATAISRGDLNWLFGLPQDGHLLAGGMLPYIMQWQVNPHPAQRMADRGCRLQALHIHHPYADWLHANLQSINAEQLVQLHALDRGTTPYLEAHLETPSGIRVLTSPHP